MSDHHSAKRLSLSSVHDSGIHSLRIPETRLLYQDSVPGSQHTFSKLRSLPRLFPIPLTVYPDFDSCYSHFMPYRMTPSVGHMAIEVHYYYYYYPIDVMLNYCKVNIGLFIETLFFECQSARPHETNQYKTVK